MQEEGPYGASDRLDHPIWMDGSGYNKYVFQIKPPLNPMKDVGGAVLAGSSPPFLGRERAAVDVDVGPERRSPRYHGRLRACERLPQSL